MLELDELELINEWIAEKIYFYLKDEKKSHRNNRSSQRINNRIWKK